MKHTPQGLPVIQHAVSTRNGKFRLDKNHTPVVVVPFLRGARCTSCKWVSKDLKRCLQKDYQKFMGTDLLPGPAHLICSDWWQAK